MTRVYLFIFFYFKDKWYVLSLFCLRGRFQHFFNLLICWIYWIPGKCFAFTKKRQKLTYNWFKCSDNPIQTTVVITDLGLTEMFVTHAFCQISFMYSFVCCSGTNPTVNKMQLFFFFFLFNQDLCIIRGIMHGCLALAEVHAPPRALLVANDITEWNEWVPSYSFALLNLHKVRLIDFLWSLLMKMCAVNLVLPIRHVLSV